MKLQTNLGNVFFELEYIPEETWFYANWIGFISVENVKKGAELFLPEMQKCNCHALLNDNRQVLGPWDKATDWLEIDWMPRAQEAGLEFMAIILAPGIAAALSAQDFHSRQNGFFDVRLFGEEEKAKAWLRECIKNRK